MKQASKKSKAVRLVDSVVTSMEWITALAKAKNDEVAEIDKEIKRLEDRKRELTAMVAAELTEHHDTLMAMRPAKAKREDDTFTAIAERHGFGIMPDFDYYTVIDNDLCVQGRTRQGAIMGLLCRRYKIDKPDQIPARKKGENFDDYAVRTFGQFMRIADRKLKQLR